MNAPWKRSAGTSRSLKSDEMKDLIATTLYGLEQVLAEELEFLGARTVEVHNRAVSFEGDRGMMYRANVHLRTALRILKPLRSFRVRSQDDLYRGIREMEWENYLDARNLIAVESVLVGGPFRHSGFVSQRVKDGIVDRFRDRTGSRPSVDLKSPDVRIHIHLNESRCSVSLDSSGESLHKRGYRTRPYKAPLNEVLAAGMILLSGWEPDKAFLNPMCGSGTLCIEAGMIARGLPGGYYRSGFGFQKWNDYEPALFEAVRREKYLEARSHFRIVGCDSAFPAIRAAQDNLARAGLLGKVQLAKTSFQSWDPGVREGILIMNPPYGERMEGFDLDELYRDIGNTLKHKFTGFRAWILSGNPGSMKHIGLKPAIKATLYNGSLPCRYQGYELYEGSRKNVDNTKA